MFIIFPLWTLKSPLQRSHVVSERTRITGRVDVDPTNHLLKSVFRLSSDDNCKPWDAWGRSWDGRNRHARQQTKLLQIPVPSCTTQRWSGHHIRWTCKGCRTGFGRWNQWWDAIEYSTSNYDNIAATKISHRLSVVWFRILEIQLSTKLERMKGRNTQVKQ